jgi:hypothetical protein
MFCESETLVNCKKQATPRAAPGRIPEGVLEPRSSAWHAQKGRNERGQEKVLRFLERRPALIIRSTEDPVVFRFIAAKRA